MAWFALPTRRGPWDQGWFAGWRGLGRFWAVVTSLFITVAALLQWAGPPSPPSIRFVAPEAHGIATRRLNVMAAKPAPESDEPGRATPGPIADPDPALLEAASDGSSNQLPRTAPGGRMPMQVYAAGFDRTSRRPRVGLVLAGIGLNDTESMTAILTLPGGVTLAISPYAEAPERLLGLARVREHEYLLSLPMEPQGFPNNDPGPYALMTNLSPAENLERLRWFMGRMAGYAGVTSALGALRGERFAGLPTELEPLLGEVANRGLYWVGCSAGEGALPRVWSRSIDLVIDEPADEADIDAKLDQLARLAQDRGVALGLATAPRPVTVDRIAAWANGLAARGLELAAVSALLQRPARKDVTQ